MLDRLNSGSLFKGVLRGLRHRAKDGDAVEKADILARIILFGVPAAIVTLLTITSTVVDEVDAALAAAALLVGALLAGFSQVASWRERILARNGDRNSVRVKALNEAGALILFSIHVSVLAAVAVFVVTLLDASAFEGLWKYALAALSSIGPASLAYVALSLVFVANLLWDAFLNEEKDTVDDRLEEFDSGAN